MADQQSPAEIVGGKYRVLRRLGSGGMANVFLAEALGVEGFTRRVVIKRMRDDMAHEPDLVAMFLDEARLAARLHHTNIAQVFDFGTDDAGYYLVMEHLDGGDSRALLKAGRGGLELDHIATIVAGAASGLHHAHELGDPGRPANLVHRDVSPSNIVVTFDGGVKVIDFGIARTAQRLARTRTGQIKGTVVYMSPEQVTGAVLDRRSDLFALGTALYELITARRPFDGPGDDDMAIMRRIANGTFERPSALRGDCPAELDDLVGRMLAVRPADRPPTGDAIALELEAIARARRWTSTPRELGRYARQLLVERVTPTPGAANDRVAELLGAPRETAQLPETSATASTERATPRQTLEPSTAPTTPLTPRAPVAVTPQPEPVTDRAPPRSRSLVVAGIVVLAAIAVGVAVVHFVS